MLPKYYFGILVIVSSAELHEGLKNCKEQTKSTYGYYLAGHVISTASSSSLSECTMLCSYELRCKSLNFQLSDKSCDLNDADRHTHPEDYGRREASVYMDTSEKHRKVSVIQTFLFAMTIEIRETRKNNVTPLPPKGWVCNTYHVKRVLNFVVGNLATG